MRSTKCLRGTCKLEPLQVTKSSRDSRRLFYLCCQAPPSSMDNASHIRSPTVISSVTEARSARLRSSSEAGFSEPPSLTCSSAHPFPRLALKTVRRRENFSGGDTHGPLWCYDQEPGPSPPKSLQLSLKKSIYV